MNRTTITVVLTLLFHHSVLAGETGSDLESRVAQLERMMDGRGLLNILNEIESLQQEVRQLRGDLEQQAYTIDQMKKRQQNLYEDLDQRLQNSSQGGQSEPVTDVPVATEGTRDNIQTDSATDDYNDSPVNNVATVSPEDSSSIKPVETYVAQPGTQPRNQESATTTNTGSEPQTDYSQQTSEMTAGSDEETRYSEAFNLLKQGKNDKSIDQFRAFINDYPSSQYADNAQYWIAEAFYSKRQFEPAIKEYKTLLRQYPDSGKASHALLKIGYCYDELGQKDFAQGELEDLIARYPGTSAATLAEERLSHIRSQ